MRKNRRKSRQNFFKKREERRKYSAKKDTSKCIAFEITRKT
jgi:hypothetical protein